MYKVYTSFTKFKFLVILEFLLIVANKLVGNSDFNDPPVSSAAILLVIDDGRQKHADKIGGDAEEKEAYRLANIRCRKLLHQLAVYINFKGKGDKILLTSMGLPFYKVQHGHKKTKAFTVVNSKIPGEAIAYIPVTKKTAGYVVVYSTEIDGIDGKFIFGGTSKTAKIKITGIVPGHYYYFRYVPVRLITTAKFSEYVKVYID